MLPGAILLLTQGLTSNPRSTAFFAKRPAPTITLGLLVLVQEVMAAMTTLPCVSVKAPFGASTSTLLAI